MLDLCMSCVRVCCVYLLYVFVCLLMSITGSSGCIGCCRALRYTAVNLRLSMLVVNYCFPLMMSSEYVGTVHWLLVHFSSAIIAMSLSQELHCHDQNVHVIMSEFGSGHDVAM